MYEVDSEGAGRVYSIGAMGATIGRDPRNEIVLLDKAVSRFHCRVRFDLAGAMLEDLGATNGCFVEGRRVRGVARLACGARVQVGNRTLLYWSDTIRAPSKLMKDDEDQYRLAFTRASCGREAPRRSEFFGLRVWWFFGPTGVYVGWRVRRR